MIALKTLPDNKQSLERLQGLAGNLQEKGLRSALRGAAKPLAAAMKAAAPDDPRTGGTRLAQAINITQAKKGARVRTGRGDRFVDVETDEAAVVVGPNKKVGGQNVAWLAWMLEGGTKPHKIGPKAKNAANRLIIGGRTLPKGQSVTHPGIRPRGWMANAFVAAAGQVEQGFYTGLEQWIKKNGY